MAGLYTDVMIDQFTGLRLLWSLKHSNTYQTRREVLREFGQEFPIQFAVDFHADEDLLNSALTNGVYVMQDATGVPEIAGILDPGHQNHISAYAGLPARAAWSQRLARQCWSSLHDGAIDVFGFPTLFIRHSDREDAMDGSILSNRDFYGNLAWRCLDLWPYQCLFDNVGMFLIRGWVASESERLEEAVRVKNAIEQRTGKKIPGLPESYLGSISYISSLREDLFECIRRWGPPTLFITFTSNSRDQAFIHYGFSPEAICEPGFAYRFAPLMNRIFKIRWSQFLADLDEGVLTGSILYRGGGVEFQRHGLAHGHIIIRPVDGYRSRMHVESEISADTSSSHFQAHYRFSHSHDCRKGFCDIING